MNDRWPLPLLIDEEGKGEAHRPERMPFGEPPFSEAELQSVLENHPELLPVDLVDPIFGPPVCIGREVSTGAGPIDNLYISPNGYLTLVETKLWKNPEARRQVVGQIIDYTKQLVNWDYTKLEEAFQKYAGQAGASGHSLHSYVCEMTEEGPDESEFIDAVGRCLRYGRFLLLIVGDGIREGMEEMASYLQQTPNIQFTLTLVELGCYRVRVGKGTSLLLVPRIVARSAEIERAIVRIEMSREAAKLLEVSTETPPPPPPSGAGKLTEEEFYYQLANAVGKEPSDATKAFLDGLFSKHRLLHKHFTPKRLSVNLELPDSDENPRMVLNVRLSGAVTTTAGIIRRLERNGYPKRIGQDFYRRLAEIHPLLPPQKKPDGTLTVKKGKEARKVGDLLCHFPTLEEAVLQLARDVEAASDAMGS